MDIGFETRQAGNVAGTHTWLTPPGLIAALGKFDLDPCAAQSQPWPTAHRHFTKKEDGLSREWTGRVWCNPPYGAFASVWLDRCAKHGNAIALTFARTETRMFHESVWNRADAVFFFLGRIRFHLPDGTRGGSPGNGSVLIAYGADNVRAIRDSGLDGRLVCLK